MWKNSKSKDRQAETTIRSSKLKDENSPECTTNINNGSFSICSRPAFGRKQTEDVINGLPALPFNKLQVSCVTNGRPFSEAPASSSIYSHPSPDLDNTSTPKNGHKLRSSSVYPDDVSPPGSPDVNDGHTGRSRQDSPNISPVSDSPSPMANRSPIFASGRFNSNIPVAKKTRKFWNRPSTNSPDRGSSLTHWDVYSGEPTTKEKGKPPQTTPSAVKLSAEPSPGRLNSSPETFGTSTHIIGGSTIGRKRVASRDPNNAPIIRPEWRGAGGRHKIVKPLFDKPLPLGKSPTFPAGSDKHQRYQKHQDPTMEHSIPIRSTHHLTDQLIRPFITLDDKDLGQPVTAPYAMCESSSKSTTPPAFQPNAEPLCTNLSTDDARSPFAHNPSNEEIKDQRPQKLAGLPQNSVGDAHSSHLQPQESYFQTKPDGVSNDVEEKRDTSKLKSRLHADFQHRQLQDQPLSPLGPMAHATTAYYSSPATPEVGSPSAAASTTSTTPNAILDRKRPVPPAGFSSSKVASRKPTPSELGTRQRILDGKRKSLPRSPPEVEATSRISSLQAKLDNLHQQRKNLQTVIHELTNVVQPSSIAYDMASRQEMKRTVEALGLELAEIVRDEHDTGLKLHRAMKRDDEFAAYEPTSIWVRRVTS